MVELGRRGVVAPWRNTW